MLRWERLGRDLKNPILFFRSFDGLELSKFAEDFLETVLLYPLQLVWSCIRCLPHAWAVDAYHIVGDLPLYTHRVGWLWNSYCFQVISQSYHPSAMIPRMAMCRCGTSVHLRMSPWYHGPNAPMAAGRFGGFCISAILGSNSLSNSWNKSWDSMGKRISWFIMAYNWYKLFFYHIDVFLILVCPTSEALALNKGATSDVQIHDCDTIVQWYILGIPAFMSPTTLWWGWWCTLRLVRCRGPGWNSDGSKLHEWLLGLKWGTPKIPRFKRSSSPSKCSLKLVAFH